MDLALNVSDFGFGVLLRDLEGWADRAEDGTPAMEQIADDFLATERRQFQSEGRYGSGGWAPLAPSTVRRRGSAHPILHETGRLQTSLTMKSARDSIRDITRDSAVLGTSTPYAVAHQKGTARMPARKPIELTAADRARITERVHAHLGINGRPAAGPADTQAVGAA